MIPLSILAFRARRDTSESGSMCVWFQDLRPGWLFANPKVMHLIYLWFPLFAGVRNPQRKKTRPQIRVWCDIVHLGPEGSDIAFLFISSSHFCTRPLILRWPASPALPGSTVLAVPSHFQGYTRAVKATVCNYTDCLYWLCNTFKDVWQQMNTWQILIITMVLLVLFEGQQDHPAIGYFI